MASLKELRDKYRKEREIKEMEIHNVVSSIIDSPSVVLKEHETAYSKEALSNEITRVVADTVCDFVKEFLRNCELAGITGETLRDAVAGINNTQHLTTSHLYEDQLEAVALYVHENPSWFESIR